jgi:TatD DNase family protein
MQIFDSHCHLDDPSFSGDLEAVIERARAAGVRRMMTVGVNGRTCLRAVDLAREQVNVFASVGIHPHDARSCSRAILEELIELTRHPKVRAWGEIGLDFNRMFSPRADQEKWFVEQLEAADRLKLPLIFHERDTGGRFLEILAAHPAENRRGVVHCFSGSDRDLEQYLALGFYIGITGILTIRSRGADLRTQVPRIPSDRLLVETDAPYLVPAPHRNRTRRNEPAFVKSVLFKLAEVRDEDPAKLAAQIWENTCRLFGCKHSQGTQSDCR